MRSSDIPSGGNLAKAGYNMLKNWYNESQDTPGKKGTLTRLGKCALLIPAHFLFAFWQTTLLAIYDLFMGIVFGLAALIKGCKNKDFNRKALAHFGGLATVFAVGAKHFIAGFAPPLAYKGDTLISTESKKQGMFHPTNNEKRKEKIKDYLANSTPQEQVEYMKSVCLGLGLRIPEAV